jgi:hypothetical protein
LFTVDSDGSTRNTFLLKIINKDPSETPVRYEIEVSGLEDAEVLASPVEIPSTEARTIPLIVRVPPTAELGRTTVFDVSVSDGEDELVLHPTFKTGAQIGE